MTSPHTSDIFRFICRFTLLQGSTMWESTLSATDVITSTHTR